MKKIAAAACVSAAVAGLVIGGSGIASAAPQTIPGNGIYAVGSHISPGTYTSPGTSFTTCKWARINFASDGTPILLAYGETMGPVTVKIERSDQAFMTAQCAEWTKVASPSGSLDFGSLDSGSLGSGSLGSLSGS